MFNQVGFTRWYDTIPELSKSIKILERMPQNLKDAVCLPISNMTSLKELAVEHDSNLKRLGSHKVMGLLKSKTKRRWYDQTPIVHKAFSFLYIMTQEQRYQVAIRMIVCIQALETYLNYCKDNRLLVVESEFDKIVGDIYGLRPEELMKKVKEARNFDSMFLKPEVKEDDEKSTLSFESMMNQSLDFEDMNDLNPKPKSTVKGVSAEEYFPDKPVKRYQIEIGGIEDSGDGLKIKYH